MQFQHHSIADGVNLYACETDKFKTVTMKVFIQQELSKDYASATALLSMILPRGSKKYPTTLELAQQMENLYGAAIGSDVMKVGERLILEFYFDMVDPQLLVDGDKILAQGFSTFWDLLTDTRRSDHGFHPDYFMQEQQNLKRLVDGLINEKRSYAIQRAISHMCPQEPFGLYKYGDQDSITALQNHDVYAYYQSVLCQNPMDIFLVGPNLEKWVGQISERSFNRQPVKSLAANSNKRVDKPTEVQERRDVSQAILVMGYRTEQTYTSDEYYSLVVCNGILGAFPHSKLFVNVREKANLAYYVGSGLEGSKGLITISAGIEGDQYEKAVDIISKQVIALQQGDISEDELIRTKKGLISGIQSMNDSATSVIDRNVLGVIHGKLRSTEEVTQAIAAVTLGQVQAVARGIELDTVYFLSNGKGDNE